MADEDEAKPRDVRSAAPRIAAAVAVALAFGLGCYFLLESVRPQSGLISFSFLLILPFAVSAFVSYVADPFGRRSLRDYLLTPVWLLGVVILVSLILLREGTICILILSPLWLLSGAAGAWVTYTVRRRFKGGRTYCCAILAAPLLVMQLEPMLPLPLASAVVSRTIVVDAPPEKIWPLLRSISDVRPGEGRWNLSQDVIGLPRPVGARLVGDEVGAERWAEWQRHVRFREQITEWHPNRRIGWRFIFDDMKAWDFTDRHLRPDSPYFRVTTGGYSMSPIDSLHTQVMLETRYWIRTPVNAYSELWGQLFMGDIENNVLTVVKQRAEGRSA